MLAGRKGKRPEKVIAPGTRVGINNGELCLVVCSKESAFRDGVRVLLIMRLDGSTMWRYADNVVLLQRA